jgi:DNA-binding HxlR family transcriptional regulator
LGYHPIPERKCQERKRFTWQAVPGYAGPAWDIFHGKWKIAIMCSLNERKKRFRELQRDVGRITGKMLSVEGIKGTCNK